MAWSASGQFHRQNLAANDSQHIHPEAKKQKRNHPNLGGAYDTSKTRQYSTNGSTNSCTKIEDVNQSSSNISVVGIIIAKEPAKSIFTRKNPGTERHLINFVVRDSPAGFVNITVWGNEQFITDISQQYQVGDVVQLTNFQVCMKSSDGNDERYRPFTPIPFYFSLSENHSSIKPYTGWDTDMYQELLHVPTKPSNDYYTLEDVLANGQDLNGEHINLLAIVKKIKNPKDITTKTGKKLQRCEILLMDETWPSFSLTLWGSEKISMTTRWSEYNTALFASDVRISFDNYRSSMVAVSDSKTIFIVDPDTQEAHSLRQYAQMCQETVTEEEAEESRTEVPLENITDTYNIASLKDVKNDLQIEWKPTVYGVTWAFLSQFNIDAEDVNCVFVYKCEKCNHRLTERNGYVCSNSDCCNGALNFYDTSASPEIDKAVVEYRIPVSFSDHTGTIDQCYLYGNVAEELLGQTAEDFNKTDIEQRMNMKWNFLLERCKVYFKMFRSNRDGGKSIIRIMSCSLEKQNNLFNN